MMTFLIGLAYAIGSTAWVIAGHPVSVGVFLVAVWLVALSGAIVMIRTAQYVHLRRAVIASPPENDRLL